MSYDFIGQQKTKQHFGFHDNPGAELTGSYRYYYKEEKLSRSSANTTGMRCKRRVTLVYPTERKDVSVSSENAFHPNGAKNFPSFTRVLVTALGPSAAVVLVRLEDELPLL